MHRVSFSRMRCNCALRSSNRTGHFFKAAPNRISWECNDFREDLRFYTDSLGFAIGQHKERSTHAYLTLGPSQILISNFEQDGTWETGPFEKPLGRGINFSFFVDDTQSIDDEVISKGVKPFVDLYTIWYWRPDCITNHKEFAVLDPDGYMLRFSRCIGSRPIEPDDEDHRYE